MINSLKFWYKFLIFFMFRFSGFVWFSSGFHSGKIPRKKSGPSGDKHQFSVHDSNFVFDWSKFGQSSTCALPGPPGVSALDFSTLKRRNNVASNRNLPTSERSWTMHWKFSKMVRKFFESSRISNEKRRKESKKMK